MLDDKNERTIRSIERARASAHSLLHRSINQLRRLQTDRHSVATFLAPIPVPADLGLADYKKINDAAAARAKKQAAAATPSAAEQSAAQQEEDDFLAELEAFCAPPPPLYNEPEPELASFCEAPESASASFCEPAAHAPADSASFCKRPRSPAQYPRNASCPCGSRQKYKRCCGRNAPPVLNRAA